MLLGWLLCACAAAQPSEAGPQQTAIQSLPSVTPLNTSTLPRPTPTDQSMPALSPTPDCLQQGGRVESFSLPSSVIGKNLQGYLYLPPCFKAVGEDSYPLLILLHGQSANADQWLRVGAAETADRLIARNIIAPLVIALPYEEYSLRNPFESGYDRALLEEFLPWLAEEYPAVCRERTCRAIGGLSRGGGWALLIGLTQPDGFRAVGGHSAPPFYGMESRLSLWVKAVPTGEMPAVYLDVGEKDRYYRSIEELHNLLTKQGIPHQWRVNPGAHDEDYWHSQVENYLRWYGNILSGVIE
ncbi:MAG: alpha/beta hydrolase-fold protein [Bellilinea sp.]|nr:alpha/beta hydrolase-fold protein [Bellilinea sp.]